MDNTAEYVSNYIELVGGISNASVRKNGRSLLPYNIISYNDIEIANEKDIDILRLKTAKDNTNSNYDCLSSYYGFGINEVSTNITGAVTKTVPSGSTPFFVRGIDGIYSYSGVSGEGNSNTGFRNTIIGEVSDETERTLYTITATAGENGTISPIGETVIEEGGTLVYVMRGNSGYEVSSVIVDGVDVFFDDNYAVYDTYATYTFSDIKSNHEISVVFDTESASYQVTVTKNIDEAGEISGIGLHKNRSKVKLTATGSNGYRFLSWEKVSGLEEDIETGAYSIVFKMPSNNVELKANFEKIVNSMLIVEDKNVRTYFEKPVGTTINLNAIIKDGYVFEKWEAVGIDLGSEALNQSIEITVPAKDILLRAVYNKIRPLNVVLGDGTLLEIEQLETSEVILQAPSISDGKTFSGWTVEGLEENLTGNNTTFTMPSNEVTITTKYN